MWTEGPCEEQQGTRHVNEEGMLDISVQSCVQITTSPSHYLTAQ